MSNDAHTPTPWSHVADRNFECRHVIRLDPDEPGTAEAIGEIIKPANAAFIVKAVNSHDTLTALLGEMKTALEGVLDSYGMSYPMRRDALTKARAVLTKAKEAGIE